MNVDDVCAYLAGFGLDGKVLELPESSATVELAALALGTEEARIAKTLSFDVKGRTILVVTAGDCKIDNRKYRAEFGCKASMLRRDEVEERTGFAPGGVCPFASKEGVEVFLDSSLKRFATVFPACGSGNSAIELVPDELARIVPGSRWVDVCAILPPAPAQEAQ